jgi:hypothetical protein
MDLAKQYPEITISISMLRYYPASKTLNNQSTTGEELSLDGKPYKGKYYITYDGRYFSGKSPETGPSKPLKKETAPIPISGFNNVNVREASFAEDIKTFATRPPALNLSTNRIPGKPNSYFPVPTATDYAKGYLIRYFIKKVNEKGYVIEISEAEYNAFINGQADYDIRPYQVTKILWKITGPLNSQRKSQYKIIPGIIDTNKRLTEESNKNFLGIVDFIGGEYSKFSRPSLSTQ